MATYTFKPVPAWGSAGQLARIGVAKSRTFTVTVPAGTPATVVQGGVTKVGYVDSDATGLIPQFTTTDIPSVVIDMGVGPVTVHSLEAITAGAASAAAAAASATAADGYADAAAASAASVGAGLAAKADTTYVNGLVKSGTTTTVLGSSAGAAVNINATDGNTAGGYRNAFYGVRAGQTNVRGWKNTFLGVDAGRDNVDGYNNVGVGDSALERLVGGIGSSAPSAEDPGARNTAVGSYAGRYLTSGRANVYTGRNAGHTITTGSYNTAYGTNALSGSWAEGGQQDVKTLSYAVCMGYNSGFNLNQDNHVAVGSEALYTLVSGSGDAVTAVGHQALYNATNNANAALGFLAGYGVTTGRFNLALGPSTLRTSNTGGRNIAVGASAQRNLNSVGSFNVAVGAEALRDNATGGSNTAIGDSAMVTRTADSNSSALGANATVTGSNQVQLGDSATTTYAYGAVQNRSDARDKANVRDTGLGLDFIERLRPVEFQWDYREDYHELVEDEDGSVRVVKHDRDGSKTRSRFHQGLIAQEVAQVCDDLGVDFAGLQHHEKSGGDDVWSIGYEELIAPLIAAVQTLSARVKELEGDVDRGRPA